MLWPHDEELVRRDPGLPGLGTLLDANAFAAALRTVWPEMGAGVIRASGHYVRYKPGTSCLVAYRVETVAGGVVDLYAKAYRPEDREKFRKAAQGEGGRGPLVLDELLILIRLFPEDGEIVSMRLLGDEGRREELLARLIPDRPDLWRGTLRRLSYKPERRYVTQLSGEDGTPRAVVKLYSEGGFERMSRNAKITLDARVLRTARRLGRSARYRAMALEWMDGELLVDRLGAADFDVASVRLVGQALAELHGYRARKKLRPAETREAEAASLRPIAQAVGQAYPRAAERIARLAECLGAWLVARPAADRAIHGDFYSKQVLLQRGGTVAFLDLDEVRRGDPAADLGNFIAHLERHALCGRLEARRAEEVSAELRKGYADSGGQIADEAVRMYTAVCLLYLSPQPFRDRQMGWPQHIDRILDRVEGLCVDRAVSAHVGGETWRAGDVTVMNETAALNDEAMPFIRQALDPAEVQRELEYGLVRPESPNERFRLRAIRIVRHKAGRRCLIEYDVESSRGEILTLVGKVRGKGLDDSTYQLNVSLRQVGFDDSAVDGICVPEPVGMIASLRMWLQRKAPGISAMALLAGKDGAATGTRLAEVAAKLHRANVRARRRHTLADELRILRERLNVVAGETPQWRDRLTNLFESCSALAGELSDRPSCGIHRDYYPDQVLIDGGRAYLLDLDLHSEGDGALDVGNCVGHVTEFALRAHGDPAALRDCGESLVERYAELVGTSDVRRAAEVYALLTLARHVHISTQFPDRLAFCERILECCEVGVRRLGTGREVPA